MIKIENFFTPQELKNLCSHYNAEVITVKGGCIVAMTSTVIIKRWELTEASHLKTFCKRGRKDTKQPIPMGYIGCLYPVALTFHKVEWRVKIKPFYTERQEDRIAEEWTEMSYEAITTSDSKESLKAFLESRRNRKEALSKWESFLAKNNIL